MKKPILFLVIGGFLTVMGIGLSVYGSQLVIENLATQQESLGVGSSMTVLKELDPVKNENGVYVVQIADFKGEDHVNVSVLDPAEKIIASKLLDHSPFQDSFKISGKGTYKLLIENSGEREIQTEGVIGYIPKDASVTVSILGVIIIIIGLLGLAVGTLYFIKTRGRTDLN